MNDSILNTLSILALLVTILSISNGKFILANENDQEEHYYSTETQEHSLRGTSRFLASYSLQARGLGPMTCDKHPRVCRAKGSPGLDCCKKRCVNVMKDMNNCGMCGNKCKYSEICCKGQCINVMSDKKHCGGCNNKCKKGSVCVYGMCSYA